MWYYDCGGIHWESHTFDLAVESLLAHRGAMNFMLKANGIREFTPCRVPHDLVYTDEPCVHDGCQYEVDILTNPTTEQYLQIMALNCRLVKKD